MSDTIPKMIEERYRDFTPPQAPGAEPPPRFDSSEPPGRPMQDEAAPPVSPEPLPPPPPGRPDPPPPTEPAWPVAPPDGSGAPPDLPAPHGQPPAPHPASSSEHQRPTWTPSSALPPHAARSDRTNGYAVASMVLGIAGCVVFVLGPLGLAFILNIPASVLAWVFGAKGRDRVDRGQLTRQRGLAQAGYVLGIVGTVVGVVAVIVWALVIAFDDGVRQELIDQFERAVDQSGTIR